MFLKAILATFDAFFWTWVFILLPAVWICWSFYLRVIVISWWIISKANVSLYWQRFFYIVRDEPSLLKILALVMLCLLFCTV